MRILDVCGEQCPYPLIKAKKAVRELTEGDTLKILTDYICSLESIVAFITKEGLKAEVERMDASQWNISVIKNGLATAREEDHEDEPHYCNARLTERDAGCGR